MAEASRCNPTLSLSMIASLEDGQTNLHFVSLHARRITIENQLSERSQLATRPSHCSLMLLCITTRSTVLAMFAASALAGQ
eukprot:2386834-Amphidinium_carterae.1